ncbi:MAG: ferrous iron transport protein B [Clostridiales bacterium]|nr:ferrous iron transport protein B [Clostridiales bacterium]
MICLSNVKIALAGNPNSGKTTIFNALTGSSQYVGNWPGVTVEKKDGRLKGDKNVLLQDLPGIYSLSPYTQEEVISRNYLIEDQPDAMINLVDGSNLDRNLYLTTQLMELGIPMVIALNMMDVVEKRGDTIDADALSVALGITVVKTSAVKNKGVMDAATAAVSIAKSAEKKLPAREVFSKDVEALLQDIQELISSQVPSGMERFFAVKVFERDPLIVEKLTLTQAQKEDIESRIVAIEEREDDDAESIITNQRYGYIASIMKKVAVKKDHSILTTSDKIDRIVTNRFLALPIFILVMFLVYYISIQTIGTMATDWVNESLFAQIIPHHLGGWLESVNTAPWLQDLILNGLVAGVGNVLGFLPQMIVLFICLAILEDCGYMARIAFIMDRIFRKFGLSGKSFIPMLIGTGCSVPAIMASRTIENEKDRRMTVMVTSFIPCSAKIPIIGLIAGALFHESPWVAPSAYFIGVLAVILSGILLKKTKLFAGDPAPFVMELPAYHLPRIKGVSLSVWDRAKAFIKKAGTIIFVSSAVIWFLQSFNFSFQMVEQEQSMLAAIGRVIAPLFAPLGWGQWRLAVGSVVGLTAKENLVSTLGILYGFAEVAEEGQEIWSLLAANLTQVTAYSFLLFNLLCAPCFAAIGAIRREMMSGKWTWIAIGYQTLLAYAAAFVVNHLGGWLFTGYSFGIWQIVSIGIVLFTLYLLFWAKGYQDKEPLKKNR